MAPGSHADWWGHVQSTQDPTKVTQNSPSPLTKGMFIQEHIAPFPSFQMAISSYGHGVDIPIRYSSTFPNVTWVKIMSFKVSLSRLGRVRWNRDLLWSHMAEWTSHSCHIAMRRRSCRGGPRSGTQQQFLKKRCRGFSRVFFQKKAVGKNKWTWERHCRQQGIPKTVLGIYDWLATWFKTTEAAEPKVLDHPGGKISKTPGSYQEFLQKSSANLVGSCYGSIKWLCLFLWINRWVLCGHYPLVMTNSSPWYRWPIEIDGLPIEHGDFPWLC